MMDISPEPKPETKTRTVTPPSFVALDVETADYGRDSSYPLALVRVEVGVDVATAVRLSAATASFTATAPHLSTCR